MSDKFLTVNSDFNKLLPKDCILINIAVDVARIQATFHIFHPIQFIRGCVQLAPVDI